MQRLGTGEVAQGLGTAFCRSVALRRLQCCNAGSGWIASCRATAASSSLCVGALEVAAESQIQCPNMQA